MSFRTESGIGSSSLLVASIAQSSNPPNNDLDCKKCLKITLCALAVILFVVGILILTGTGALNQVGTGWGGAMVTAAILLIIIPCLVDWYKKNKAEQAAIAAKMALDQAAMKANQNLIPTYDKLVVMSGLASIIKDSDLANIVVTYYFSSVTSKGTRFVTRGPYKHNNLNLEKRRSFIKQLQEEYDRYSDDGQTPFDVTVVFEKSSQPDQKCTFTWGTPTPANSHA